ncbi:hypothetical protein ACP4OV_010255 [Aristida adscensionis]
MRSTAKFEVASYNSWVALALIPQFHGSKAEWPNSYLA